jgi:hypothetical protein
MPDDLVAVFQYLQRPENPELHVCSSLNTDTAHPLPAGLPVAANRRRARYPRQRASDKMRLVW